MATVQQALHTGISLPSQETSPSIEKSVVFETSWPKTGPEYTWLYEDLVKEKEKEKEKWQWLPFRSCDQKRLEDAEAALRAGEWDSFVRVEGGRWQVNLKDRLLTDSYGSDAARRSRVRRARWFQEGKVPYSEHLDASFEELWERLKSKVPEGTEGQELLETLALEEEREVVMKAKFRRGKWLLSASELSDGALL